MTDERFMSEDPMSEERAEPTPDRLDAALENLVDAYTADAPPPPDVNRVLSERAARPRVEPAAGGGRLRPLLLGALGLAVIAGGAYAVVTLGDDDGGQTLVPADDDGPTTVPDDDDNDDGDNGDGGGDDADGRRADTDDAPDADGENQDDRTDRSNNGDLGIVAGSDGAETLPDAAPETYWAVRAKTYDLIQVEARTGRILANLGGWGEPNDVDEGELIQALQTVEIGPDGSLFVDDCCEPAFGSIYQLAADQEFDPETADRRDGLNAMISPSGELVMFGFGGSVQISSADFSQFPDEGWPQLGAPEVGVDGLQYVPLAWIDDRTIAVRIFGREVEQVRIYELIDRESTEQEVIERRGARRTIPDRFYLAGATRSDGMLVVAGRRPNGDPLGLAGGGDLVAEVIDPANGQVIAEFDLPDRIFDIDYDSSGRFLLTSGEDGVVRWFGVGQSGVLAEDVIQAAWN